MILYADAKNAGSLNEEKYAKKLKFSDNAFSTLMLLQTCSEKYESLIHRCLLMKSILESILNSKQAEAYRKKLDSGSLDSTKLNTPIDISFLNDQFLQETPLEKMMAKMEDIRQEMDSMMQILNVAAK